MIPILLVCGPSESGKTTLIERLIPVLAAKGLEVGTVKHHRGRVALDTPGKDTWRHRQAGARATFFVTEKEVAAYFDRPRDLSLVDLARLCPPEVGMLVVEGFKGLTGHPRVEVMRRGVAREVAWNEEVVCVATDIEDLQAPCPIFALDDAEGIAQLLLRRFG